MSASANTVGGVPVGREDDAAPAAAAATADVVVVKLKQPLSPEKKNITRREKEKERRIYGVLFKFFFPKNSKFTCCKRNRMFFIEIYWMHGYFKYKNENLQPLHRNPLQENEKKKSIRNGISF